MLSSGQKREQFSATLAGALGRSRQDEDSGCPPPSIISAYRANTLRRPERAAWEGHFANCPRCQTQLNAMERKAADARERRAARVAVPGRAGNRSLAPAAIAGGVAVVVIAVAIGWVHHSNDKAVATQLASAARANGIAAPAAVAPSPQLAAATAQHVKAPVVHATSRAAEREAHSRAALEAKAAAARAARAKAEAAKIAKAKAAAVKVAEAKAAAVKAAEAKAAEAKAAAAKIAEARAAEAKAAAAKEAAEKVAKAKAAADKAAQARLASKDNIAGAKLASAPEAIAKPAAPKVASVDPSQLYPGIWKTVASPDGTGVWQVGPGGRVYRHSNGKWVKQFSGSERDLLVGSSPSPQVCWVTGRGNTVLRTIDGGAHWSMSNPPPTSVPITWIAAMNGTWATVTTADGSRYTTFDGGRSWRAH